MDFSVTVASSSTAWMLNATACDPDLTEPSGICSLTGTPRVSAALTITVRLASNTSDCTRGHQARWRLIDSVARTPLRS